MSSEDKTLEITSVRIFPFDTRETGGRTLAYAEIEIGGALLLRGIRVLESEKQGLFLGFPSQRAKKERFIDLVVPLGRTFQLQIREAIIEEYKRTTGWKSSREEEDSGD
jgi:DNA-binding cell septation regulator SpoVG